MMPDAGSDSGSGALGRVALASLAVATVLAGPEVALATTDTTFGDPLDTVQDIVGGTGGQLAAAPRRGRGPGGLGAALQRHAADGRGRRRASRRAPGTGIVTGLVGTAIVSDERVRPPHDPAPARRSGALAVLDRRRGGGPDGPPPCSAWRQTSSCPG